jgi:hypothetical protein
MIDNQKEISLAEFKAWLAGLIRGKRGALPDLDDWKAIKETLDKIVPDTVDAPWTPPTVVREIIREAAPLPEPVPYINPYPTIWITEPNTYWPKNGDIWCGAGDDLNSYGGDAGAGSFPQGQGMCGGSSAAGAGNTIGSTSVASGGSTITIDNSAMSPTTIKESGDTFTTSNGFVTFNPEQMQFSYNASEDSEGQLNDAMSMMFTEQSKELT